MAKSRNPFMPFIDKQDFDAEAQIFLTKYCPEALHIPMPIPIWDIAKKKMSLDIIQTENLSPDKSVQGAIAFTKGIIDIYDWSTQAYIGYEVKKGMVFLDVDIMNEGRENNTLAHECFHWYKHRSYFVYRCGHNEGVEFAFRCDKHTLTLQDCNGIKWSDEEKMEWQARTIAPKILMPKKMTIQKTEELYKEALHGDMTADRYTVTKSVIDKLAAFFCVSKQSASIRMQELGYHGAYEFYQYDEDKNNTVRKHCIHSTRAKSHQQKISVKDAFKLYCSNDYLKATIGTGEFCYVDGYFVLKNDKYIFQNNSLTYSLTEYAKIHLAECTLDFSTKLINDSYQYETDINMMYRHATQYKKLPSYDSTTQNIEIYNKAKALEKAKEEFEVNFNRAKFMNQTATQLLWHYIQIAKWNTSIFQDKTLLSSMDYTRVQKPSYKFTLEKLIAMSVGLQLTLAETSAILHLAGLGLIQTNREHKAYEYILTAFQGCPIDECNDVIISLGVKPLGSSSRDK